MNLPDPRRSPSRMEQLSHGVDCAVHPLVGNVVAQNGVAPEIQTRNFLWSLRHATEQQVTGRAGDLTEAEFLHWMNRLQKWEQAGNTVKFPPRAGAADHPRA